MNGNVIGAVTKNTSCSACHEIHTKIKRRMVRFHFEYPINFGLVQCGEDQDKWLEKDCIKKVNHQLNNEFFVDNIICNN
ncbi:hypothetical protein QQG55_42815 [Brugia pahangi]